MHATLEDRCSLCQPPKSPGIGGPLLLAIGLHAALLAWPDSPVVMSKPRHEIRLLTTLVTPADAPAAQSIRRSSVATHPAGSSAPASSFSPPPLLKTTADSPHLMTTADGGISSPAVASVSTDTSPEQADAMIPAAATQPQPGITRSATAEATPIELADLNVVCPQQPTPAYPLASRRLHETGQVVLKIALDNTGRILSSEIRQSSGSGRLDRAALETVKGWRCHPARREGQPVASVALQRFEFALQ